MKIIVLLTTGLLTLIGLTTQAQTTKLGSAGNKANYGTTKPRPVIGSGSTGSITVDGSNGSATNDGASGQNGSPAPLPAATANQQAARNGNSRSTKSVSRNVSSPSSTSSRGKRP